MSSNVMCLAIRLYVICLSTLVGLNFVSGSKVAQRINTTQQSSRQGLDLPNQLRAGLLASKPDYFIAAGEIFQKYEKQDRSKWPVAYDCLVDLLAYRKALVDLDIDAKRMFEAQGSMDLKLGEFSDCGHYVAIGHNFYKHVVNDPIERDGFYNQFCTAQINSQESLGLCVPDSCSTTGLSELLKTGFPGSFQSSKILCEDSLLLKKDGKYYNMKRILLFIIAINILATILTHISWIKSLYQHLLTLLHEFSRLSKRLLYSMLHCLGKRNCCLKYAQVPDETVVDFTAYNKEVGDNRANKDDLPTKYSPESSKRNVISCFSISDNIRDLMRCEPVTLSCVPAIRVISMSLVVFYHTYYYTPHQLDSRPWISFTMSDLGFWVAKSNVSVEAFFVVSAMLAVIQCISAAQRMSSHTGVICFVTRCYIKRIWRLAPVYYILVFIQTYMIPYLQPNPSKGPKQLRLCRNALTSHLSFTYNLNIMVTGFPPVHCLPQAWYICADMQLFLIIPWLALLYNRYPKKAVTLAVMLPFVVFLGITGFAYYKNQNPWNATWTLYALPEHINSYLVGMLLGFVYVKTKFQFTVTKILKFAMIVITLFCIYMVYIEEGERIEMADSTREIIYVTNWRTCYAILVVMLILYCSVNTKNVISWCLSSTAWLPLSRLSYCIYLVSCLLQKFYFESSSHLYVWRNALQLIFNTGGFLMSSTLLSIALWLCIEKPCDNIAKLIFK